MKILFVVTPLIVIINIHFAYVLYTHYDRRKLYDYDGGCVAS